MVGWPPERLLQRLWSPSTHGLALCDWLLSLDIAGENGCGHKAEAGILGLSSGFHFRWQHRAGSVGNLWQLNRHGREFPGCPLVSTQHSHCQGPVQSLVRELRSHKPSSAGKKKKRWYRKIRKKNSAE